MKWLSVHVGGQKWRVDLIKGNSKHFEAEADERVYGITHADKCRIYIAREQDEQVREDTLLHELLHAVFGVSGASNILASVCGERDAACKTEEDVITAITPLLHRALKEFGFRFPKGPGT